MLTLNDGRSELWQWDTGRTLAVDADCSQVHFSNKVFGRSIDVDVVDGVAIIPDVLLQTDKDLNAWAFVGAAESGYTKISKTFKVNRRNKPADYVFTPTEQTTIAEIAAIAQSVRDDADAGLFGGVQPDWNQNDSTAADYVKNRPFYTGDPVKTVIIPETTVAFSANSGLMAAYWPESFDLVEGQTYTISWDGTDYVCTGVLFKNIPLLGNLGIAGAGEDTGEPFVFLNQGQWIVYSTESAIEHAIGIKTVTVQVVTIDKKYLPDSVFTDADWDSVSNRPIFTKPLNANITAENMTKTISAGDNYVDLGVKAPDFNGGLYYKAEGKISFLNNSANTEYTLRINGCYKANSSAKISFGTVYDGYGKRNLDVAFYGNNNSRYGGNLAVSSSGNLYSYTITANFTIISEVKQLSEDYIPNTIQRVGDDVIISSSTPDSTKKFKITVDDSGTISATEVI